MVKDLIASYNHIFKLDPNREISDEQIKLICQSGTDAIIVGGTLGITYNNTIRLLREIRKSSVAVIQEITNINSIVPGFDYYFIPLVINAQNPNWIINVHQQAIKRYGDIINWDQVFVEGYIILNEDSSAARLTESKTNLMLEDVLAYATVIDQMLKLPILYIEYSGVYGNVKWLRDIKYSVNNARVFYGGGIDSVEKAKEASEYADTIVVGNVIYENFNLALKTVLFKNQLVGNKNF
ncbi:MAG: heptaprenylglyceryl phosphate synthase [Vulcanibacillus sp.]